MIQKPWFLNNVLFIEKGNIAFSNNRMLRSIIKIYMRWLNNLIKNDLASILWTEIFGNKIIIKHIYLFNDKRQLIYDVTALLIVSELYKYNLYLYIIILRYKRYFILYNSALFHLYLHYGQYYNF